MAAYCRVYGVIHFTSPAGWLPVHQDQLRAQCSVTSTGKLYLFTRLTPWTPQTLTDTSEHIQFLFFTFSFILLFMFGLSCFFKTDFMDSLDCYLYRISENICFYFSFFFFSFWLHAVNKLPYVSFSAWVKTVSRMACRHIFIYFPLTHTHTPV